MRVHYNAPVVLTFSLLTLGVFVLDTRLDGAITRSLFVTGPPFSPFNPLDYLRLVSHTIGHGSYQHLFSNLTMILLLGPILEERYGSEDMFKMMALTALSVGIMNLVFVREGLLGASSIVFMFITLISIVDLRRGSIPISFIVVALLFIGNELYQAFQPDNISQMGHIAGAILGAIFGFTRAAPSQNARPLGHLVNWTFDHFWLLAGILSAVVVMLALIMAVLMIAGQRG